jgi:general secretion pathway protein G
MTFFENTFFENTQFEAKGREMLQASTRNAGFSLVEILLVIVIILMLAGALVVFVLPQQEGAQINTTRVKLQNIETALTTYKLNVGTYPAEPQGGLAALLRKPMFENEKIGERWRGPYVKPGTVLDDAWGRLLIYEMVDKTLVEDPSGPDFRLFSVGPDGLRDTPDDIHLYETIDPAADFMDGGDAAAGGIPAVPPAPAPIGGGTSP